MPKVSLSQRTLTSKAIKANTEQRRRHNPHWLYLFLIMAILSGIVSTITYLGDRSLEKSVDEIESFKSAWNTWRTVEDSIREELDLVGLYLGSDSGVYQINKADKSLRQRIGTIQRCIRNLQVSKIPRSSQESSRPIYDALADLSIAGDSLAAIVTSQQSSLQGHGAEGYTTAVRALNAVRNSRVQIVDNINARLSSRFKSWHNFKAIVNLAVLMLLGVLVGLGVLVARKYARSESQRAVQFNQLRESETRFRTVVANVPGVIFRSRIAKDWPIEFISENVERITGYPASDFVGNSVRRFGSLIHPADVERMNAAVSRSIEFGTPYAIEYRLINSNGEVVWVDEYGQAVVDESGKPQWLDGALLDVTDRKQAADDLAQSEETLRALIDASPGIALLLDNDGRILTANEALARNVGISRENLVGMLGYEIVTPERMQPGWQHFRNVVELGKRVDFVQEFENAYTHVYLCPIIDNRGNVIRVAAFGQDITDRKRAEEALAESERHLRLLAAGIPGVLYQFKRNADGSMCFPFISDGAKLLFGIEPETAMADASSVFKVLHLDDVESVMDSIDRATDTSSNWQEEFRCLIKGEVRWIRGSALPHPQVDGSFVWNGMLVDITAQKAAEEQLRQSEERFRKIFDAAGFGMAYTDLNGVIRESNRAFQEMVQYSGDELRGMNFTTITHHDDIANEQLTLKVGRSGADHSSFKYEKRYIRKDGKTIWARLSVVEFTGSGDQPGYYIGMAEEITERKQSEQKIRESEELYRTLFENSGEGLFLMNDKYIDCNERAAEILKCPREKVCGKSPVDFSPEFQPDGVRSEDWASEHIKSAYAGNTSRFNWKHLRPDGVEIDTEVSLKPVIISGNTLLLATVRDISERVRIERELRESLIQLDTLVESAVDGIVVFAQDGEIESANPAAERMLGSASNRLIGTNIIEIVAEPHRTRYRDLLCQPDPDHTSNLLRGVHEVLGIKFEGIVFPMDLAISPLELSTETKYVAIIRDISERRSAEQQIIENEARLEAILSSSGDGIIVIDRTGSIQVANNAAQEIFGFAANELVGCQVAVLIHGIDTQPLPIQGQRTVFDSIGKHRIRGEIPLQVSISSVSVGASDSYAVIARDMTEEFNRRERLIEADKLTSIGTLAGGIAHEFKNYLAGIIGNASFALDGLNESGGIDCARDAFEQIIAIGEKADEIALSLLTYSHPREGDLEPLDLRELINSTLRFAGKELIEKNVGVVTEFEEIPLVMVSASRAQQVFLNLIINAVQAVPNGGLIRINVGKAGNTVLIRISDNGVGISAENLRRIFDPFFSTKGVWGKDAVSGTGLGLTICRNIVNSFGGEISAESTVGKGSTFTISLPIPAQEVADTNSGLRENVRSVLLISPNSEAESAFSGACQGAELEFRLVTGHNFADCIHLISRGTLVIIDCKSPYLGNLIRIIEFCRHDSIRTVYINRIDSAKELMPFIQDKAVCFDNIPEFTEIITVPNFVRA